MNHVAIMRSDWKLIPKILSGQKTIESRWYQTRRAPWNRIHMGDIVYFKDSGKPVTAHAEVTKVKQFSGLTPQKVKEILNVYGKDDGIEKDQIPKFFKLFRDKRYCILIFLKHPKAIGRPFLINKKGYGLQAAWMVVEKIEKIKLD